MSGSVGSSLGPSFDIPSADVEIFNEAVMKAHPKALVSATEEEDVSFAKVTVHGLEGGAKDTSLVKKALIKANKLATTQIHKLTHEIQNIEAQLEHLNVAPCEPLLKKQLLEKLSKLKEQESAIQAKTMSVSRLLGRNITNNSIVAKVLQPLARLFNLCFPRNPSLNNFSIKRGDLGSLGLLEEAVQDAGGKDAFVAITELHDGVAHVSVEGLENVWDRHHSSKGDIFYTGATSRVKHALKNANTVGASKLVLLNQERDEISAQIKTLENKKSGLPETEVRKIKDEIKALSARKQKIEKEKPALKAKIETRKRLITTLSSITSHGRATEAAKKVGTVAKRVGEVALIPFKLIGKGVIAAGKAAGKVLGIAAEVAHAVYKERAYHIPREVTFAINDMKTQISNMNSRGVQHKKDTFKLLYKNYRDSLKTSGNRMKFDQQIREHGDLLTLAIFHGDADAQGFLLEKGLFTTTKSMLKALDSQSYQTKDHRNDVLRTLAKNCHNAEDLSTIVKYLRENGEIDLAKDLVSEGLEQCKNAGNDIVKAKKYERCQLLVPQFGDPKLFEAAFGVDPSKLYAKGAEATLAKARQDFIHTYRYVLESHTRDGQNIMHQACLSNEPSCVQFLTETMYMHNQQTIENLKDISQNLDLLLNLHQDEIGAENAEVEINRMVRGLDSRHLKSGNLQKKATQQLKNSIISKLPTWMFSDNSMGALVNAHRDCVKQLREPSKENNHALIAKRDSLERHIQMRIKASITALEKDKHPMNMRDKNFVKPKHFMSMELANGLDRISGMKGNKKGSYSNNVGHRQFMKAELSRKETAFLAMTTIVGKWIGCLGPTHMLVTEPDMGIMKELFAINGPLFTVGGAGFLVGAAAIYGWRKHKAREKGMDTTLSQSNRHLESLVGKGEVQKAESVDTATKTDKASKPEIYKGIAVQSQLKRAMKRRDLDAVEKLLNDDQTPYKIQVTTGMIKAFGRLHYFESDKQKQSILASLCERCDQRKIYKLLDKRVEAGDKEAVKAIVSAYIYSPDLDKERYKGLLQVAAKLGDRELLERAIEKGKTLFAEINENGIPVPSSKFLLEIMEPKSGDTLLHLAMATKDVSIITLVAHELIQASENEKSDVVFKQERTGKFKKLIPSRWRDKEVTIKYGKDIFELVNPKTGKTVIEGSYFDKQIATQLDEAYGLIPDKGKGGTHGAKGTFTQLYEARQEKHRMVLAAEISGVLPFKAVLNLAAGEYIKDATLMTFKATSHVMTGGASLLATTSLEFLTGCGVMAVGFCGGFAIGGAMAKLFFKFQMKRKGLESSATQLASDEIPPDILLARYAHGRKKALRSLKKEKMTESESTELRQAFKTVLNYMQEEAQKAGDLNSVKVLQENSIEVENILKNPSSKDKMKSKIGRQLALLAGREGTPAILTGVGTEIRRQAYKKDPTTSEPVNPEIEAA